MEDLALLLKEGEEGYRKAALMVEGGGRVYLEYLWGLYLHSTPEIRSKVVKLLGSIDDPRVIPLLKKALRDKNFVVRRTAAISLSILTNEDFFGEVFKSSVGQNIKRSIWTPSDVIKDEEKRRVGEKVKNLIEKISPVVHQIVEGVPCGEFFLKDRHTLKDSFVESVRLMVEEGELILYMVSLFKKAMHEEMEEEEREDIIRSVKYSICYHLDPLKDGIFTFFGVFSPMESMLKNTFSERESFYILHKFSHPASLEDFEKSRKNLALHLIDSLGDAIQKLLEEITLFSKTPLKSSHLSHLRKMGICASYVYTLAQSIQVLCDARE